MCWHCSSRYHICSRCIHCCPTYEYMFWDWDKCSLLFIYLLWVYECYGDADFFQHASCTTAINTSWYTKCYISRGNQLLHFTHQLCGVPCLTIENNCGVFGCFLVSSEWWAWMLKVENKWLGLKSYKAWILMKLKSLKSAQKGDKWWSLNMPTMCWMSSLTPWQHPGALNQIQ